MGTAWEDIGACDELGLRPTSRLVAFRSGMVRPAMVAHARKIAIESLLSVSWGIWTLQPRWCAPIWLAIGRGSQVAIIALVRPHASITDSLSEDADGKPLAGAFL